jgi:hypothetical protein
MSELIGESQQEFKLEAGEELVLQAGVKDCRMIVTIIEGEVDMEKGSELMRIRRELEQIKIAFGLNRPEIKL